MRRCDGTEDAHRANFQFDLLQALQYVRFLFLASREPTWPLRFALTDSALFKKSVSPLNRPILHFADHCQA
jgi:hypothetical protein